MARPADKDPRWRRRSEARPSEIVRAAIELFAEHGYAATRMQEIAERAGITAGTVYRYFESKEALFRASIAQHFQPALDSAEARVARREGDPAAAVRELALEYWSVVNEWPWGVIPRLVMSEAAAFPELARLYVEQVIQRRHRLAVEVLRWGMETGAFREVDAEVAARAIIAPVVFTAMYAQSLGAIDPVDTESPAYVEGAVDLMLSGLRRSGSAAPE